MSIKRLAARLLCSVVAFGGVGVAYAAPPPVEQMLAFKPKQEGVVVTTPQAAEVAACKVDLVKGQDKASGWVLLDGRGQPLRRFFDANGDGQVDIWSYYLDGKEVYREQDTNFNGKADNYRWFDAGGSRWGVDVREEGRITMWRQISAEEVSQEILQSVIKRDFARLQALLVSDEDLKALDLPASEAARIRDSVAKAPQKFQALTAKLVALNDKTQWQHLETGAPQCVPADALGTSRDLIHYRNGTVLYATGDKHDFLQTGELVQVGPTWKIVGAPADGQSADIGSSGGAKDTIVVPEEAKAVIAKLRDHDAGAPKPDAAGPDIVRYNLTRATLLSQVIEKMPADQRESWIRQMADCLSAASQNSPANDRAAYTQLVSLRDQLAKDIPGSALAGYVTFREMSAEYAARLAAATGADMAKVQEAWSDRLKKFVNDFPTADDAPDAMLQLGMVNEFVGKETEAKNYYGGLAKMFPKHPLAIKASGAVTRLELDGKPLTLAGQLLGRAEQFDLAQQLRGKSVVIYYWASWNAQCAADFVKLKNLLSTYGSKGVELVCVNLDNSAAEAVGFLGKQQVQATHLHAQGGLDSPLAQQYGVMVLPHMFLVNKDGKVASRNVQIGNLEDEIKKLIPEEKK